MRYSHADAESGRTQEQRAAVFVDYENLYTYLHGRVGRNSRPDEYISELLDELHRYLLEELRIQTSQITAYADFSEMQGNGQHIQRSLYLRGIEPRFVPMMMQKNAAEIQLSIDAVDALHTRKDIRTFVILAGDRPYLPLVQQFKQHGRHAIIATLAPPPATDNVPYVEDDVFLNALNMLSEPMRRSLNTGSGQRTPTTTSAPQRQQRPQPVEHHRISNHGALRALEIIEEYFGQYEEVYLTPLLRKLSELLDENRYDPKTLISELESAGAVWLEKRRGFPYDYTVLLIDTDHPDVQEVQKAVYERGSQQDFDQEEDYYGDEEDYYGDEEEYDEYAEADFDEDDYDEEEYDEYAEDDFDEEPYTNGSPEDDEVIDDYEEEDEETH